MRNQNSYCQFTSSSPSSSSSSSASWGNSGKCKPPSKFCMASSKLLTEDLKSPCPPSAPPTAAALKKNFNFNFALFSRKKSTTLKNFLCLLPGESQFLQFSRLFDYLAFHEKNIQHFCPIYFHNIHFDNFSLIWPLFISQKKSNILNSANFDYFS